MNHAMLQRIVEEVAARLRRRARSTATLSVAQLGEADIHSLLCQHASLRIVQVDLPLPDAPMILVTSPSRTVKSISRRTVWFPNVF